MPQARGRAATEELVDGVPFGLAVMMLFHGVTMLMNNGNVSQVAVRLSRVVAVWVAPVLTLYYITNGATDTESARLAQHGSKSICSGSFALPTLGIMLTGILAVVLIASLTIGRRISKVRGVMRKLQIAPPIIVVGFSVGAAVLGGTLSTRSDDFLVSQSILNWYLVLTSVVLAVIAAILAIGGGRDRAITEDTVSKDRLLTSTAEPPSVVPVGQLIAWRNPTLKAGAALVLGANGGITFKAIFRRRR